MFYQSPNLRSSQSPVNPGKRISGTFAPFLGNIFCKKPFSFPLINLAYVDEERSCRQVFEESTNTILLINIRTQKVEVSNFT